MPPRTSTMPPVSSSPPPTLYETSISTHEETSWHSSSYQSRGDHSIGGSGGAGGAPRTPKPLQVGSGGAPPTTSPVGPSHYHRGWFPKSHPKSPRYDPRAFRRDEYHRPVHSEPILVPQQQQGDALSSNPSRFRRHQQAPQRQRGGAEGSDYYPDPEPNLLSLESNHDDDDDAGRTAPRGGPRLPVFTVDGIASEVALGSRNSRTSPSRALTRDLLSRLDARRNHKNQQQRQKQLDSEQKPGSRGVNASRRDAPPLQTGSESARTAVEDTPSRRVREQAAASRTSWKADSSKRSGRQSPGRQTPPPPDTEEAPNGGPRSGTDWQRRAEIETPEPARVTDLKQRLWDDRESLQNKSPVVHRRHVDLHYDREGLNQRWKQWHGEVDKDRGHDESTPARSSPKPMTTTQSNSRSRSLSPGAASGRSRTPPPPMVPLPLTPASVYSTPKPHQMFQSRFVQAAQRASPAAPHYSYAPSATTATKTTPARLAIPTAGNLASGSRRDESAFVVSSPVSTKDIVGPAASTASPKPAVLPKPASPAEHRAAGASSAGQLAGSQAIEDRPVQELSSIAVADLVARLQKVRRENPDQALAEIDAIIQQSQGHVSAPTPKEGAARAVPVTSVAQAAKVGAGDRHVTRGTRDEKYATTSETRGSALVTSKNEPSQDAREEDEDDDALEGSDDDETSVSSITNPTYGVVGSEYHHPRPTVLSTLKGAGQPRPSALSNYNGRSSLRTTDLQQPAYGRSRRQARHRSPPPASIHVTCEAGNAEHASYQQLQDDDDNELDAVLGTAQNVTSMKTAEQSEGAGAEQVEGKSRVQPSHAELATESRSVPVRNKGGTAPATSTETFSIPTEEANSEGFVAPPRDGADLTLDPSHSAELAQKIKKDEMSEPDFCPAAGCLNSKSSDQDLHRSAPLTVDSLVDMVCPRESDASAMKRRHHPWDASIPVCMGQVNVHETSMDHAAGVEAEYSMKYRDARSEMSVSVEASSGGGVRRETKTRDMAQKSPTEPKVGKETKAAMRGDAFDINPRLVSPDSVGESGTGFSSEHQAYARNLADDFDSAWVSLPSSAFFRDARDEGLRSNSTDSDKLSSQAKVLSVSRQGESSSPRRHHHDQYQTFRPREGGRKNEHSIGAVPGNPRTTKTFEMAGNKQGENGGFEVAILNDVQPKPGTSVSTASEASRSRRGLRKFLKLRQAGKTSSMSQGSVSSSSRSHLQSVSLDLQSASLDMEATEVPPPPSSRGRSLHDASTSQSPDRLRSRSLDERRIRNPHIAKKFSRLLRVYEENPSKQFGII